jgi:hypothetical protein
MKNRFYTLSGLFLLGTALVMLACEDKYYTINNSFYDGMQITLKNPLQKGETLDTLSVELLGTDQIMIQEVSDSALVLDSRAFIYKLEYDSIATVGEDGTITPLSKGTTRLDITFRANAALTTSIIIKVYKEYVPVISIQVPDLIKNTVIEVGEPFDLSSSLVIVPANADNKKLHFSIAEASMQYASITDDGIITGLLATGRNKATVQIVSDDNDTVKTTFGMQVVAEIVITEVTLRAGLDSLSLGIGEKVDLNLCTSVKPDNVNPKNRTLTFELLEGTDVLDLSADGVITAKEVGTAKLKATSKNGKYKEFTIFVKTGLTDLNRLLWTVTTSVDYGYFPDGTTGMAEDMFDNNTGTYFAVVKPGKTYSGKTTPADHIPYFIVDMKSVQKFNYIRWNHRSSNSYDYLRVWGIDFAGSNDGETFTTIQEGITIDKSVTTTLHLPVPVSEYRYVKVMLTKWSDNSGGSTSGNTMQVAEFGLGYE